MVVADGVAAGLSLAGVEPALTRAPALGVGLALWVAVVVTAVGSAGGGEGLAWTADPLLVPLAISAPATTSTTTAIPVTTTRRIQYV